MKPYPFHIMTHAFKDQNAAVDVLNARPCVAVDDDFASEASKFIPGAALELAINTAVALGEPLLLTGEPGTGKTQAAYYVAQQLKLDPVIHFQVKSDACAKDLLYHFDAVRYFHEAHLHKGALNKADYLDKRALWEALESTTPRVLLIDEIDKAPRDFPNDLLLELDKMTFTISETQRTITGDKKQHPIVFITSNSERRLPEAFLRRCVYHHIEFDDDILAKAVAKRETEFNTLSQDFIKLAIERFVTLRELTLRKPPSTGEFLVWLRVLALTLGQSAQDLDQDLSKLPYLNTLLKDHQDMHTVIG